MSSMTRLSWMFFRRRFMSNSWFRVSRRYRSPLYLTNRGREVFAALQARIASMEDAASMGLTEEQRSKMYAALELICGNLERLCAAEQEDTL